MGGTGGTRTPASGRPAPGSGGTRGALVLCGIGAALVFLQSFELVLVGSFYSVPTWGGIGLTIGELGGFGICVSLVLVALAVFQYFAPERHLVLGVGMITFSVLSLYSGGGALLGFLLCYVAGLIVIFARPPVGVRRAVPIFAPQARDDPVIEADLIDSGFSPQDRPEPDTPSR